MALLLRVVNGQKVDEVKKADFTFVGKTGLSTHLSLLIAPMAWP
jgi:sulfur transfer protein SufE